MAMEMFVNRRNAQISIKFGLVGLGQAGGKIVDSMYSIQDKDKKPYYSAIAVNSFVGDLKALKNIPESHRYVLKGFEKGCARDPRLGYEALESNDNNKNIYGMMERQFEDSEYILLCAGLGGGTGTGILLNMIEYASYLGKPVGIIITLPRQSDSIEEKSNALEVLIQLREKMKDQIAAIIPVDNEKLYQEYLAANRAGKIAGDVDWKEDSNRRIAEAIHEINICTAMASSEAFDSADFTKILTAGGSVQLTKTKIPAKEMESWEELSIAMQSSLEEDNLLCSSFNYASATHLGTSILRPHHRLQKQKYNDLMLKDIIDKELKNIAPNALGYYTGLLEWESDYLLVYSIIGGMDLPYSVFNLDQAIQEHHQRLEKAYSTMPEFTFKNSQGISDISRTRGHFQHSKEKANPFESGRKSTNPFENKVEENIIRPFGEKKIPSFLDRPSWK